MGIAVGLVTVIVIVLIIALVYSDRARRAKNKSIPIAIARLLAAHVEFYNKLDATAKQQFEARVRDFLDNVTVRGVDVTIDDRDKVLVAAGAIMLIFSFPDWKYNNISEVLLYQGAFSREFSTEKGERNVLGMVGDGAMHREMVMSLPSLRASFAADNDGQNTALHEFAHLIDKADGAVDGVPEYLVARPYLQPWAYLVRQTISDMRAKGSSDIDMYGATNEAEFFAVIVEYFFERPELLREHHPELYSMLLRMFHPQQVPSI